MGDAINNDPQRSLGRAPRVGLLGATLGTGNLGVDALGASTVQGLVSVAPDVEVAYQSWVHEPVDVRFGARVHRCEPLVVRRRGTMRRPDGVAQLRRLAKWREGIGGGLAGSLAGLSRAWTGLTACDVVLDLSAGDSFADIYGEEVFWYQSQLKLLCLDLGIPLILMPQTIGPFRSDAARRVAAEVLSRSTMVCCRETVGLEEVQSLCGGSAPCRVVESPDLAFLLDPSPTELPAAAESHVKSEAGPLIAINVSGLLYSGRRSFGLAANHRDVAMGLVRWALRQADARVLLVPHVLPRPKAAAPAGPTSDCTDNRACEDLIGRLTPAERGRVDLLAGADHPGKAKQAMSRCDFFVGARMHAFIGATSQLTPGALLAYSKKAAGTTRTIGMEEAVVDLRTLDAEAVVAEVEKRYHRRDDTAAVLRETVPVVKTQIERFFRDDLRPKLFGELPEAPAPPRPDHDDQPDPAPILA